MEDDLKEEIMKFNKREQQAIAELVDGSIIGHTFFVSKKKNPKAALQDKIVPHIFGNPEGLQESIQKYVEANERKEFKAKCTYEKTEFYLDLPMTKNVKNLRELSQP